MSQSGQIRTQKRSRQGTRGQEWLGEAYSHVIALQAILQPVSLKLQAEDWNEFSVLSCERRETSKDVPWKVSTFQGPELSTTSTSSADSPPNGLTWPKTKTKRQQNWSTFFKKGLPGGITLQPSLSHTFLFYFALYVKPFSPWYFGRGETEAGRTMEHCLSMCRGARCPDNST